MGRKKGKRCRSWRYTRVEGHENAKHRPHQCRKCWAPCRNRLQEGEQVRCAECERALAAHPDLSVRRDFVSEEHLSTEILKTLTLDGVWTIAEAAQTKLDQRESGQDEPEGPVDV